MSVLLLGIDWADEKHDACLMDESGKVLGSFSFPHSQAGLEQLRDQVRALASEQTQVLCALETNHGLLVDFLLDQGWTVYPINPKSVDRYRDRTRVTRAKSDQLDAWLLADILRTDRHLHRSLQPDSEAVQELRQLTRDRVSLVEGSVRLRNQLQATLKAYWPESLSLFSEWDARWVLAFLVQYPTHQAASSATVEELRAFLRAHRHPRWRSKAETLHAALQQPHIKAVEHLVRSKSRHMVAIVAQLKPLVDSIKAYDEEIERLFKRQPDGQLYRSLPGAGPTLAARLLAEIGDIRERYATANSLQCAAGTAPVTRQTGKSSPVVQFRRAVKKPLRQAFQLFASSSLSRCDWALALYTSQRAKGKHHQEAIRIVANRWAKIIFAMRQTQTLYDEFRFMEARERHLTA